MGFSEVRTGDAGLILLMQSVFQIHARSASLPSTGARSSGFLAKRPVKPAKCCTKISRARSRFVLSFFTMTHPFECAGKYCFTFPCSDRLTRSGLFHVFVPYSN